MVMNLHGASGTDFEFTHYSWRRALSLARRYGWQPGGTRREADSRSLGYVAKAGQRVTAADAAALAAALERALPDVPRHDAMEGSRCELGRVPNVAWFSGPRRQLLQDFIRFCRSGGFRID